MSAPKLKDLNARKLRDDIEYILENDFPENLTNRFYKETNPRLVAFSGKQYKFALYKTRILLREFIRCRYNYSIEPEELLPRFDSKLDEYEKIRNINFKKKNIKKQIEPEDIAYFFKDLHDSIK